ncbi:MAG: FtsX-like permease family protein [Cyclobacteriaceae bacterium]
MLKNYLKVAIRNLLKHRVYSAINIVGLTMGLTCCLLILVYITDELSYDKFHEKADRIVRLQYNIDQFNLVRTPPPMADGMREYFSEIESIGRMYGRNGSIEVGSGSDIKRFEEERLFFIDSTLFDVFTFNITQGQRNVLLTEPHTVILNEEMAGKYFGNNDPVGQTIRVQGRQSFRVIAVAEDFPSNSHWHFNMLMPYHDMYAIEPENVGEALAQNLSGNWLVSHSHTYMTLKEPLSGKNSIEVRMPDFLEQNLPEGFDRGQTFNLQPLSDIRLNQDVQGQIEPVSNLTYLYMFIGIAVATLLIACINFINLATARSLQRVKEVGMRKVMGAWKTQLVFQFLGESLFISFIAFVIALGLATFCLPALNELTDKQLTYHYFFDPMILSGFFGLFLLTGVLAGLYPAFFVTKVQPALTLKGIIPGSLTKGMSLRRVLVIIQFTVAIVLISGTVIIHNQMELFRSRPLGFQKEQIVNIPLFSPNFNNVFGGVDGNMRQRLNTFEEEIANNPAVLNSTLTEFPMGFGAARHVVIPQGFTDENSLLAAALGVDYDFLKTFKVDLIAGRGFDKSFGTDHTSAMIINEKAIETFNFGSVDEAIGKDINMEGKEAKVIGIVKDFNFEPLQGDIEPLILHIQVPTFTTLAVNIQNVNIPQTLSFLEEKWNASFPEKSFDYDFLDEQLATNYEQEERLGQIINYFAALAILISCLGSYGLVMFLAQQKMKEIGIRKVLGASIKNIVVMLSRDFVLLIGISFLISVPVAYYFMNDWLSGFTYRVDIGLMNFMIALAATLTVVLLTISYQAIKSAIANPIVSLRQE